MIRKFERNRLNILPLAKRESKSFIENIAVTHEEKAPIFPYEYEIIETIAQNILRAKKEGRSVILAYGAHLIKNGLSPLIAEMVKGGYITHLATNGAGSIHDWEFAFHGKTEEDVRKYVDKGQFGIWDETGKFINLALLYGAYKNQGYGSSVGEMISQEYIDLPSLETLKGIISTGMTQNKGVTGALNLYEKMLSLHLKSGKWNIPHPFKKYTLQNIAFECDVPLTIHPGFGYDIIYSHPFSSGAAIGLTSEVDFLKYVESVSQLEGGVYLSIGSAIMSPMIFEKSISMARNIARQNGKEIRDFLLVVNDIQKGNWNWGTNQEPPKDNPAYYLRFCKTFDRIGAREMKYICLDNRNFLLNIFHCIKNME